MESANSFREDYFDDPEERMWLVNLLIDNGAVDGRELGWTDVVDQE